MLMTRTQSTEAKRASVLRLCDRKLISGIASALTATLLLLSFVCATAGQCGSVLLDLRTVRDRVRLYAPSCRQELKVSMRNLLLIIAR